MSAHTPPTILHSIFCVAIIADLTLILSFSCLRQRLILCSVVFPYTFLMCLSSSTTTPTSVFVWPSTLIQRLCLTTRCLNVVVAPPPLPLRSLANFLCLLFAVLCLLLRLTQRTMRVICSDAAQQLGQKWLEYLRRTFSWSAAGPALLCACIWMPNALVFFLLLATCFVQRTRCPGKCSLLMRGMAILVSSLLLVLWSFPLLFPLFPCLVSVFLIFVNCL